MAHTPPIWTDAEPSESGRLVVVSTVFMAITTIVFLVRQAWRWTHRQRGWDDIMAACAYVVLLVQTIFGGISAHYGFGKHMADIMPTFETAMEYFYLYQICYKILGGFTKLTFCFLYLRIFDQRNFRLTVWTVSAIITAGTVAFALGTVFQCTPLHRAWDKTVPGHCISNVHFWFFHAAFNVVMDIVVYVLPIPLIGKLKLARGQKTGLISIFGLGAFVIAAAIVRMVMLRGSAATHDPTWGSMNALIWTEIEANVSVICCCMPALRVPILNLCHKVRGCRRSTTPEQWVRNLHETAWDGGHRTHAEVQVQKPANSYQANAKSLNNSDSSGGRSEKSWYDKVRLSSLVTTRDREKSTLSRSSSRETFAHLSAGMPPPHDLPSTMELGAIYKTTDIDIQVDKTKDFMVEEVTRPR